MDNSAGHNPSPFLNGASAALQRLETMDRRHGKSLSATGITYLPLYGENPSHEHPGANTPAFLTAKGLDWAANLLADFPMENNHD